MKQKILSSHILAAMILMMTAMTAKALEAPSESSWESGNTTCQLSDDGVFTVSPYEGTDGAMADYNDPTERPWHGYYDQITSVVVEDGVTTLGKYVFHNFENATSYSLPETLLEIHSNAFRYCKMDKITIPNSVTTVSTNAFWACKVDHVYCYAAPYMITWGSSNGDFITTSEGSWPKYTQMHVFSDYLEAFQTKFSGSRQLNVTFVGDLTRSGNWTDEGNYATSFSNMSVSDKTITITNEAEMARLAYMVNKNTDEQYSTRTFKGYTIKLARDLNMVAHEWSPIGTGEDTENWEVPFIGTFDGQNHTIYSVTVNRSEANNGLFGFVGDPYHSGIGQVKNVRLMNSSIKGGNYTGALVGYLNFGMLTNCFTNATVNGGRYTGGLVGSMEGKANFVTATVNGCLYMGTSVIGVDSIYALVGQHQTPYSIKSYYTYRELDVPKSEFDVYAVAVDVTGVNDEDVQLTFSSDGKVEYDGTTYCATNGSATFTVEPTESYITISSVTINGTEIGTTAGTYTFEEAADADICRIAVSVSDVHNLADDKDNTPYIDKFNEREVNATLSGRTLYKDGSWNTLCLPFNLEIEGSVLEGDGVQLMTLNNASFANGTLTLDFKDVTADGIQAGVPYFIKWNNTGEHLVNPSFRGVTIDNTSTDDKAIDINGVVSLKGTYLPLEIGEDGDVSKLFLGAENTLYYPNDEMTINSFRAYFQLAEGLYGGEPDGQQAPVRAFILNWGNDSTTGIKSTNPDNGNQRFETGWHTIDGRRLSGQPTQRGIYLNNGKKLIIK